MNNEDNTLRNIFAGKQAVKRQEIKPGQKPYYYINPIGRDPYASIQDKDIIEVDSPDVPNPALQPNFNRSTNSVTNQTSTTITPTGQHSVSDTTLSGNTTTKQPYYSIYDNMTPIDCSMNYDGVNLNMRKGPYLDRAVPAYSGLAKCQQPEDLDKPNCGRLPEGMYYAKQEDRQKYNETLENFKNLFDRGSWPGGTSSWGDERVWLTPDENNNMMGRGGFSIHGGTTPGSLGCIDITKYTPELSEYLDSCQNVVPLRVKYSKDSW